MNIYEIEMPDGSIVEVEGAPDQAKAMAFAKTQWKPKQVPSDTSITSAFSYGIDQPLEAMGDSFEVLGAAPVGKALKGAFNAPKNYDPATPKFLNPGENDTSIFGYGVGYFPRALVEQAGQVSGSILSRVAGGAVGGAAGSAAGSVIPGVGTAAGGAGGAAFGAFMGPAFFGGLQTLGTTAKERAKANGRDNPNDEDINWALGTAAASGVLEAMGAKYLPGGNKAVGGFLKRMLLSGASEGATETAQSLVQQVGSSANTEKGLSVSPHQAIGEGLLGVGSGAAATAAVDTAKVAAPAVKTGLRKVAGDEFTPVDPNDPNQVGAAERVSLKLRTVAANEGWDLTDVDRESDRGGDAALNYLRKENNSQMLALARVLQQDGILDEAQAQTLGDTLAIASRKGSLNAAKTKVQSIVPEDRIAALEAMVGHTQEGQQLVGLVRESNIISGLFRQGVKGGFSRVTDQFSPFEKPSRYLGGGGHPLLTLGGAALTGGKSLVAQAAITGGGRLLDGLTGNRSRYNKFAQRYANPNLTSQNPPVDPNARGIIAERTAAQQAVAQAQQQRQARQAAFNLAAQQTTQQNRANDIIPGGGFDRAVYDNTGLKPSQWMKAVGDMLQAGEITQDEHDAFLNEPQALMDSGRGLQIMDAIGRKAEAGQYTRDDSWVPPNQRTPPQGSPGPSGGYSQAYPSGIRNPLAYEAQAKANQERVTNTLNMVQQDPDLGNYAQAVAEAVGKIGTVNNKAEARVILKDLVTNAGNPLIAAKAAQYLAPLVDQIRHENPKAQPLKPVVTDRDASGRPLKREKLRTDKTEAVVDAIAAKHGIKVEGEVKPEITPDGRITVNGNDVGYVKVEDEGTALRIADIEVKDKRKGIGSSVIKQVISQAEAQGKPVVLSTDAMRGKEAVRLQRQLYERLGFKPNKGPDAVTYKVGKKAIREELVKLPEVEPESDGGFSDYLTKVNPGGKRIPPEDRPNLGMGDMHGMIPKGSVPIKAVELPDLGTVTFVRDKRGDVYAKAFNPDLGEKDVIGYIKGLGKETELAVVAEAQGKGVGAELQYLFRKENPFAPSGGLTEAGERSLKRVYERLKAEGILDGK